MVDDSNRFFKSKAVCAVRYANFKVEVLQKRRFDPIFPESARQGGEALPTAMSLGNRKGRLVQIRAIVACAGNRER
jgi:hypothetical protein